jgi:hypothetical protein
MEDSATVQTVLAEDVAATAKTTLASRTLTFSTGADALKHLKASNLVETQWSDGTVGVVISSG